LQNSLNQDLNPGEGASPDSLSPLFQTWKRRLNQSGERKGYFMKRKTSPTINSIYRGLLFILLVLGCFGLLPTAQAVVPAPDGGYPGNNTADGQDALFSLSTGLDNTANGFQALFNNTFGSANTASGSLALYGNTTGNDNTATGRLALYSNTTGGLNTATGDSALFFNTTGNDNTATGAFALSHNTTGGENTATGGAALESNTTGSNNTATGGTALESNTTGRNNTATGALALYFNDTGNNNTATGVGALFGCSGGECGPSTGSNNTATGTAALLGNVTGLQNTATGSFALYFNDTGNNNTADGFAALLNNTTGAGNIALGNFAGSSLTNGNNNIDIGNPGVAGEANTIRIGTQGMQNATYVAGIFGKTTPRGTPVFINANGQLATVPSSARFKEQIKPMGNASEAILALKPVTFRYTKEIDPERTPEFGLVAEDVEKVNPDLVAYDPEGKVYTVRYEAVNAMLLNEFLKEHRTVQELKSSAAKQEATIARLQKQVEALTAGLQRVNDKLEMSKPAPQIVLNNQ
jgi:trimeric autotransporter adhesin